MTLYFASPEEIEQIMLLADVENSESAQGYYYNRGSLDGVSNLIDELKVAGVDPTVLCFTPPHDPQNCYYTPKNAVMTRDGWE